MLVLCACFAFSLLDCGANGMVLVAMAMATVRAWMTIYEATTTCSHFLLSLSSGRSAPELGDGRGLDLA